MPFFTGDLSGLLVRLHDENLRVTRQQSRRRWVHVELAKTAAERLVLIDSQLLIAKEEHQVVHEGIVDLLKLPIIEGPGQIETKDLSASARCRFPYLYSRMSHAFVPCGRRTQIVRNTFAGVSEFSGETLCSPGSGKPFRGAIPHHQQSIVYQ